ncbi:MAG: type II toxin-antitoxin system VapC family toxin [Gemmatimonadota bacterium]
MYLLDTDTCVWALRNHPRVKERLRAVSPEGIATTMITEAELRYGSLGSRDPAGDLQRVEAWLSAPIQVLPFDRAAAAVHSRVRYALRAQPIGAHDLLIASITLSAGRVLVTSNLREFRRVPGLEVEDWT